MAGEYNLSVILGAQNQAGGVIASLASQLAGLGGPMGAVAGIAVGLGAAIVGVGATAVKMAGDFQSGMTTLVTGAGEAQSNIGMVSNGILQMAIDTGTTTKQLTDGMYMIESAGYHGADGLNVLKVAAEGAKVGNADLGVVANAVTTVLTDYHMKSTDATAAMNALITTVASGKTHLQDLASSMGSVLPLASSLGISFPQVAGALATMTNAGMDAQRASQNLANAIRSLSAPSGIAKTAMDNIGLSAQQVKDTLGNKGLAATIQMIEDHVGKTFPAGSVQAVTAFKDIMGGATGYNVALMLGGQNMKTYQGDIAAIAAAMQSGSKDVQGWSNVQNDFNFKMDQAKAVIEVLMIKIGTALLPVIGNIVTAISGAISGFMSWEDKTHGVENALSALGNAISAVTGFFQSNSIQAQIVKDLLIGIGIAIAAIQIGAFLATLPALIAGFGAWAISAGAAAIATLAATWPLLLVVAIIALVVAGIILAMQHWGDITKFLQGVWAAFVSWFQGALTNVGNFFKSVWDGITSGLQAAWNVIVNIVKVGAMLLFYAIFGPIILIVNAFEWLYNHNYYFKDLIDTITNVVKAGIEWLQNAWQTVISWLTGLWSTLSGAAQSAWGATSSTTQSVVGNVTSWLKSAWTTSINWLSGVWNTLSGLAQKAWNAVVSVFQSVWAPISGALSSLWNNISSWFSNLASQALAWGKNLIQGFINGITSMAGAVGSAVGGIANNVKSFLGFHSPTKEGPGSTADQWAPALMTMFVHGIEGGLPKLKATLQNVAQTVQGGLSKGGTGSLSGSVSLSGSAGSVSGNTIFILNFTVNGSVVDHTKLLTDLEKQQNRLHRMSGLHTTVTSGGKPR